VERAVDDVAEGLLGVGEAGRRGGQADIAHDGQVEPPSERGSVDGGHERQRKLDQRAVPAVRRVPEAAGVGLVVEIVELVEVEPSRERVAGAGDHDHLGRVVAGDGIEEIAHLVPQIDRERVPLLRSVEGEQPHPPATLSSEYQSGQLVPAALGESSGAGGDPSAPILTSSTYDGLDGKRGGHKTADLPIDP
jgi:hypothetical protein